jgi:hypothetical protein
VQKFYSTTSEKQEMPVVTNIIEDKSSNCRTDLFVNVPIRKIGIRISNLILKRGSGLEDGQSSMLDYL